MTKLLRQWNRRRRAAAESGQAAVEFALVLPIMLLIMVGMLEFARAWNLHEVMTDAVREGARRAVLADSITTTDSVMAPMARYLAQFGYDWHYATMQITPADSFKHPGALITVSLSLPYRFWVLGSQSFTMRSSFTVRNE